MLDPQTRRDMRRLAEAADRSELSSVKDSGYRVRGCSPGMGPSETSEFAANLGRPFIDREGQDSISEHTFNGRIVPRFVRGTIICEAGQIDLLDADSGAGTPRLAGLAGRELERDPSE